ncbi:MAG TPA: hypothetical protein VFZ11_12935 [Gemmatimonadaceae bacterium]
MKRLSLLAAAIFCTPLGVAEAQRISTDRIFVLEPGTRIRIVAPGLGKEPIVGTIAFAQLDTIVLDTSDVWRENRLLLPAPVIAEEFRHLTLSVSDIDSVQVSRGHSRARGMLSGAVKGGLIVGAYLGLQAISGRRGANWNEFAGGFASGLAVGASLGVPIGYVMGSERWRTVRVRKPFSGPRTIANGSQAASAESGAP